MSNPDAVHTMAALTKVLDACPDGVVMVDAEGTIVQTNTPLLELLGYTASQLIGETLELLIPQDVRDAHRTMRQTFQHAPTPRTMAEGRDLEARHHDGHKVPVDIALAPFQTEQGSMMVGFVRDATARRVVAEERRQLERIRAARDFALETNDNVLQGLATALWELDLGDVEAASTILQQTLASARDLVADLLNHGGPEVQPGQLVRQEPAPQHDLPLEPPSTPAAESRSDAVRVLLADDAVDLRTILRIRLARHDGIDIVGEASDGQEALDLTSQLTPDVILLDLSMPRVDGLQAAETLRAQYPEMGIVVLSGHPSTAMRDAALRAGADVYIEKSRDLSPVVDAIVSFSRQTNS